MGNSYVNIAQDHNHQLHHQYEISSKPLQSFTRLQDEESNQPKITKIEQFFSEFGCLNENLLLLLNKPVLFWSSNDLSLFMTSLELQCYIPQILESHSFSPKSFLCLSEEELKTELQIKSFGHRKTLYRAIELLKSINSEYFSYTPRTKFKEDDLFERIDEPMIRTISHISNNNDLQTLTQNGTSKEMETWSSLEPDCKMTLENIKRKEEITGGDCLKKDLIANVFGILRTQGITLNNIINFTEIHVKKSLGNHKFKGTWLGREVLLKKYHIAEKEEMQDFINKLKKLGEIRHPNMVLMMGFSLEGNSDAYIVTEFIEGENLECNMKKKNIDFEDLWEISLNLTLVLGYLEKKNVKDCVLDERNIMVLNIDEKMKIKVNYKISKKNTSENQNYLKKFEILIKKLLKSNKITKTQKQETKEKQLLEILNRIETNEIKTIEELCKGLQEALKQ